MCDNCGADSGWTNYARYSLLPTTTVLTLRLIIHFPFPQIPLSIQTGARNEMKRPREFNLSDHVLNSHDLPTSKPLTLDTAMRKLTLITVMTNGIKTVAPTKG